ncbi:MAG: ParB N-terminal domain-containing protein [Candidatus Peribacteraceae bacterium]|nr:ParB N-terminal domain-containing protein [Candidatus Peribacteraceae bacterium]
MAEQIEVFHSVALIELGRIRPNDYNPNAMPPAIYQNLVDNIKARGFKSAIYVRAGLQEGTFVIVDGEHRWRAAQQAGALKIPCVVLPATEQEAMLDTITMNQLRGNLVPVKLALVIAHLAQTIPVPELERQLGFEEKELQDTLELLKLPDDITKTIEMAAEMEEREALNVVTFVLKKPAAELVEKVIAEIEKEMEGKNTRGQALERLVQVYQKAGSSVTAA